MRTTASVAAKRTFKYCDIEAFLRLLAAPVRPLVFNPWTQRDEFNDGSLNGPPDRLRRLRAHLSTDVAQILVGEAAGYQGCHVSGIPFTSERVIMAGEVPRVSCDGARLSLRVRPWSEPSATTVWRTLHALDIAHNTILWNAYPWHPFQSGKPHSNRTPSRSERVVGVPVLIALLSAFSDAAVFAVGRHAEHAISELGRSAISLRHPSMGGAVLFRKGLIAALRERARRP
jgi:uracil-DNA glycosylase